MYVTLVLAALLILGLSGLTAYLMSARRKAGKQRALAARLEAVAARAAREHNDREAAARASSALTTVLPAIQNADLGQSGVRRLGAAADSA
jgi:hypothetical protein